MIDFLGHFLIFTVITVVFLALPLTLGKLLRPKLPTPEKDAIYECGEPTIGSSYVQFDLRFYVVALLFIIFDVEVAFFFPWATVFGNATQLADPNLTDGARMAISERLAGEGAAIGAEAARSLALVALVDILVFFGVLLVGFAYVWKRGDLDWVRAVISQAREAAARQRVPPPPPVEQVPPREPQPVG